MTLLRKAPREVYRVYGEDEYPPERESSAGEGPVEPRHDDGTWAASYDDLSSDPHTFANPQREAGAFPTRPPRRNPRTVMALLTGIVATVLGVVVLNVFHRSSPHRPAHEQPIAHASVKPAHEWPIAHTSINPALRSSPTYGSTTSVAMGPRRISRFRGHSRVTSHQGANAPVPAPPRWVQPSAPAPVSVQTEFGFER